MYLEILLKNSIIKSYLEKLLVVQQIISSSLLDEFFHHILIHFNPESSGRTCDSPRLKDHKSLRSLTEVNLLLGLEDSTLINHSNLCIRSIRHIRPLDSQLATTEKGAFRINNI